MKRFKFVAMKTPQVAPPSTVEDASRESLREVTLQDVAEAVQMSLATASMALNGRKGVSERTRQRVRQAARELGFQPNPAAQHLASKRQNNTVILCARTLTLGVGALKLQLLQNALREHGFQTPIHILGSRADDDGTEQAAMMEDVCSLRPRAIVCESISLNQKARNTLHRYTEAGGRLVCYDYPIDLDCDQVIFDREDSTYQAAKHLLELGHRNIGFYIGNLQDRSAYAQVRMNGLRRALQEFDVPLQGEWTNPSVLRPYEKAGARLGEFYLAQKSRPTAMCIVNDHVSLGFLAHMQRHGIRVPHDVSIVSHDDVPVAEFGAAIPLTTVTQPIAEIAQQVAQMVVERLNEDYRGPARQVKAQGKLVVRDSTLRHESEED